MDNLTLMERIHSTFGQSGATNEIISTIKSLEESVHTLTDYITKLKKIVDGQMKGKTRDAFIDRIEDLEQKRRKIEDKMKELRGSVN
ncbi:hypothetical protein WD019_08210 [Fictibacillus sp. Mic-4]|uniref:hypothetical protein n=1 Tax=Fictibacillus sp. Mic-4 TaxID=3132826 RepID=UPI003CFA9A6D